MAISDLPLSQNTENRTPNSNQNRINYVALAGEPFWRSFPRNQTTEKNWWTKPKKL